MSLAKKTKIIISKNLTEAALAAEIKPGYIADFISGLPVKDTPEERDAVQVFARRLVEDYGYPKELIQTRPQYRVRKRPSDEELIRSVHRGVQEPGRKMGDRGLRLGRRAQTGHPVVLGRRGQSVLIWEWDMARDPAVT